MINYTSTWLHQRASRASSPTQLQTGGLWYHLASAPSGRYIDTKTQRDFSLSRQVVWQPWHGTSKWQHWPAKCIKCATLYRCFTKNQWSNTVSFVQWASRRVMTDWLQKIQIKERERPDFFGEWASKRIRRFSPLRGLCVI